MSPATDDHDSELGTRADREGLFDSPTARARSCYSSVLPTTPEVRRPRETLHIIPPDRLWPVESDELIAPQGECAHDMLRAHILGEYYPCVGARAAFSHGHYRLGFYPELGRHASIAGCGRDLRRFAGEYEEIGHFTTFVAIFRKPQLTTETQFERLLWQHLQGMHDHDGSSWDPHYASDPQSPDFAFSFAGKAFFVVGMHSGASRFSRRFAFPALVFNPESQIRHLKETNHLGRFTQQVRERDIAYQGSINPSIPTEPGSTGGEAHVYSGKKHTAGDGWRCPFHARVTSTKSSDT